MALSLLSVPASARPQENITVAFDIYVKGLKMFGFGYQFTLMPTTYTSKMSLKPRGVARWFANVSMVMDTVGEINKTGITPVEFTSFQKKDNRKRNITVTWTGNKLPTTSRSFRVSSQRHSELQAALKPGMSDPLSAFLDVGTISSTQPCSKTYRIYDGATVYDLAFKFIRTETFGPNSRSSYKGVAYKCQLVKKPIAGFSKKSLIKQLGNPLEFTVWFAPVKSSMLAKTVLVPVSATGFVLGQKFRLSARKTLIGNKPF